MKISATVTILAIKGKSAKNTAPTASFQPQIAASRPHGLEVSIARENIS
jgi:hypothetical protein